MRNARPAVLALVAFCTLILVVRVGGQDRASLTVMPLPAHMVQSDGEFAIDWSFGVALRGYQEPRLEKARQRFLDMLWRETGIPFRREIPDKPQFVIQTAGPSAPVQQLGEDESYHLEISTTGVRLTAPNPIGTIRGLQTFLQLVRVTPKGFSVPAVVVDDEPRFPWRGLLIDSGHRFVPVPVVKRNLDGMEAVKLNVFHWRFADNQGFHIESKKFPLLHQKGSGGFYYTQEEVRDVIAYARDRGIRVVPEFDMPCHTSSWFRGYPELTAAKDPSQSSAIDPTRESTYKFLAGFITEMTALFPDAYFHAGGDECDVKGEWETNPRILEFMRAHAIKDGAALQALFTAKVQKIIAGRKKIMVGWDEVLRPDTPKDVVIHSWRGPESLAEAARSGYRVVLSNGYYIDLNQSAAEHYLVDPLEKNAATLTPDQKACVLGGEATMWTDIVSYENVDNRIWPRTAAIAERFWSPEQTRDIDSMYRRLAIISRKLDLYGLRHHEITDEMLRRMTGVQDPGPLKVLAAVVQPPRNYERQDLRSYGESTALNRLDDAVPPESETAREFADVVKRIVSGQATPQDWQQARQWLELWRDNDAKLQPLLAQSFLTRDLVPMSRNLSQVAEIGLQALNDLQANRPVKADTRQGQIDFLKSAERPQAVLLLMVAPPVKTLVEATKIQ